ncbi:MAG: hypothetical protein Q7R87_03980 [Nanoarchaeota archaeon]|nr:hypothetical protein [Nanoarchaeota archaeon]
MKINNSILQFFALFFIFLLLSSNVYASVLVPPDNPQGDEHFLDNSNGNEAPPTTQPNPDSQNAVAEAGANAAAQAEAAQAGEPNYVVVANAVEAAQTAAQIALDNGASPEVAVQAGAIAAQAVVDGNTPEAAAAYGASAAIQEASYNEANNVPPQNQQSAEANAADNRVKVTPSASDDEKAAEAAKGVIEKRNQEIRNRMGDGDSKKDGKTNLQKAMEFLKSIPSRVKANIISTIAWPVNLFQSISHAIKTGNWAPVVQQLITGAVTAAGLLLGAPPGLTTAVNTIIDGAFNDKYRFDREFPKGVEPIDVTELTPEAAEAIKDKFEAEGYTVEIRTETVDDGSNAPQTIITNIVINDAPEGDSLSVRVDINGVPHTVVLTADGSGISVSSDNGSPHPQFNFIESPGSLTSYVAPVCGDGNVVLPEQCDHSGGYLELLSSPDCTNTVVCEGQFTGQAEEFGSCTPYTCQCSYLQPSWPEDYQLIVGSCGAECNSTDTSNCQAGESCSPVGLCGPNLCGNRIVDQGEQCDPAPGEGSGCSGPEQRICRSCTCIPLTNSCSNGRLESFPGGGGEICDTGIESTRVKFFAYNGLEIPPADGNIGICRSSCKKCICQVSISSYENFENSIPQQTGVGPEDRETCQNKKLDGSYDQARDEDCDGAIDEDETCTCNIGDERGCGEVGGWCGVGGRQTCIDLDSNGIGEWGACVFTGPNNHRPTDEIGCDTIDNDCDGAIDECGCQNFAYFNVAFWESYDGLSYSSVSSVSINASVYPTINSNLSFGVPLNFSIYESDCPNEANLQSSCLELVDSLNTTVLIGGINILSRIQWNVSDKAVFDSRANDGLLNRTFFFIANASGYTITSSKLFVDLVNIITPPGSCNIDIITGVGKLNHRGIYFANKSIEFNQSRVGDNVNVLWNIEGENEPLVTNTAKSFVMNFSRPGQKTITLKTNNIQGCVEQSREVSILVIASPGLFTYINAPFYNQAFKFTSDNIIFNYKGNESYVVNSESIVGNTCGRTITCLAGNCPSSTSNTPEGCSSPPNNLPVTTNGASDKFANINFTWSKVNRDGEDILTKGHGEVNASGDTNYNRANHKSNAIGDKQIKLVANYTNISNGISLQNIFTRNFTLGTCINGGRERLTVDSKGRVVNKSNTLNDRDACSDRSDGELTCCPFNHLCSLTSGLCEDSGESITGCSDYKDRSNCELDPYNIDQYEYRTKIGDAQCNIEYECVWNNNLCSFNTTELDKNGMFGGSCLESAIPVVRSTCDNGELTKLINITSTVSGELSCLTCQSGVFEVPCGRPSIELPFFGIQQIILSLISIIGLYLFMFRRKAIGKHSH